MEAEAREPCALGEGHKHGFGNALQSHIEGSGGALLCRAVLGQRNPTFIGIVDRAPRGAAEVHGGTIPPSHPVEPVQGVGADEAGAATTLAFQFMFEEEGH